MEDMRIAASVLKGRKVADGVRVIVIPATQQIYLNCVKEGLAEIFVEAGAIVSTPTCGPCLGGHMGILATAKRLFQPQTVTLSAEWDTQNLKFILLLLQ